MLRSMTRFGLPMLFVGLTLAAVVRAPAQESKPLAKTAEELHARLTAPIDTDGFEPNTPLREALGFLSERHGLTILIDSQAFRDELKINEPAAIPVKCPKLVNVPVRTALRILLDQAHAGYAQEGSIVWVVPKPSVVNHQLQQEVDATFQNRPLDEALRELTRQTGFSIVVDASRTGEHATAPVTAKLNGVSLETAVRVLADAAELKAVLVDKVLYVTTPENAEELRAEQERRRKEREAKQKEPEKGEPKAKEPEKPQGAAKTQAKEPAKSEKLKKK